MTFQKNEKGTFDKNGVIKFTKENYEFTLRTPYNLPIEWVACDGPEKLKIHKAIVAPTIEHFLTQFEDANPEIEKLREYARKGKCQDHWDFWLSKR